MLEYDPDYTHLTPHILATPFLIDESTSLLRNIDDVTKRDDEGRTLLHILA
jgi:hypothetical protein